MIIDTKKVNPLVKSTFIYLVSTLVGQGMSFVGIIVFTRLMSQTDYGNYSTYYASVSIFTVLVGMNLYYALNNAYIDKSDEIKGFRKSVLVLSILIALAMLFFVLGVGTIISEKCSPFIIVIGVLHSYGFFVVSYRIYSANMENDFKKKGLLLILPNTLQFLFALSLLIIFPQAGFSVRVLGSSIAVALIAGTVVIEILRDNGNPVNLEYWKYALSISLPTVVMSLSYMLMQQCDKVMIQEMCGADDTAVYSVIYYLGYVIIAIDQAVAPVRQAWIYKRLGKMDTSDTKQIQKWYLMMMMILATVMMLVAPEMVKLLAPENYWRYEYIAPFILSACFMMLYRFYTEIILFYKKNMPLSASVLICALLNIVLNYMLIPRFGAIAACYTTVVAYFVLFILTWILAEKCCKRIYSMTHFALFIIWIFVITGIFSIIDEQLILRIFALILFVAIAVKYILKHEGEWKNIFRRNTS